MAKENETQNPITAGMMERRTVAISGEVNYETVNDVGSRMLRLQLQSNAPINFLIDSGGGGMDSALLLCDIMTNLMTAPVRGIALGRCGSAATFIMLHCHERLGTPYSRFLIHSGVRRNIALPINQTSSENLENLLQEAKAAEAMVTRLYMNKLTPKCWNERTTDDERAAYVQKLVARGDQRFNDWMSAEEAIEVGLIQQLVTGKLDIFPN
jgi:ATP-dependent protease ClpP protease subunit